MTMNEVWEKWQKRLDSQLLMHQAKVRRHQQRDINTKQIKSKYILNMGEVINSGSFKITFLKILMSFFIQFMVCMFSATFAQSVIIST